MLVPVLTLLGTLTATGTLVYHFDERLPVVRFRLLTTFLVLSSGQLLLYALWKVFLKPLCFSPFKHLPKPPLDQWPLWRDHEDGQRGGRAQVGIIHCRGILNGERLIVSSPTALAKIASDNYTFIKPMAIKLLAGRVLGMGLVLTERDEHKQQRKLFLPPFAPKHIRDLYPTFWRKSREVTERMGDEIHATGAGNGVFEIGEWAARVALDIITLSTMGKDFGSVHDADAPLAKVYHTVLQPTLGHVVIAVLKNFLPARLVEALPLRSNRHQGDAYDTIRGVCRGLLREKKDQLAGHHLGGKDILSVCLRYEDIAGVDEEEVINQMTTILGAGHETISVGITWAIYMLCLHRDWQARLREEVRATLPSPDRVQESASSADVERMPLMRAFLEEVLRWYPPIPMTMRESLVDTELDGQYVPRGTRIVVPIKAINREERYWGPDAKRFSPSRWLKNDREFNPSGGVSSKYGYLSFMHGPRSCVASEFARAEMACVVSAWVGRFDLDLSDERFRDEENMRTSNGNFSGKPLEGLYVRAQVLEGW
ncbi:cytochrome P450 [Aspergillus alliaceus]|uniref:cytochrome P450 n=1 Tax=Petromyces alliaceus TaxID=209559 RepID=UPI0012A47CF0|nr:cytochrome P450 [Aspergillus alliaceus]KAB8233738.1 cytochrome P450 [Aspergillus alliaceus]